jgi:hypothetical protein
MIKNFILFASAMYNTIQVLIYFNINQQRMKNEKL